MLAPQMKQWESEGRYLKTVLFQHKVFCKDIGNPAASPDRTLLLLHGFPDPRSPSTKWSTGSRKFLIASCCSTSPATGSATSQRELHLFVVRAGRRRSTVVGKRGVSGGHVLSHDMGDSVHTEFVRGTSADCCPRGSRRA